jgi:RNA polymerase sigma-70 factor (ECF subfamily)
MQELPSACRSVFELMYVEGLTPRETGIRLNISVNTVRNQHVRGLRKLQQSRLDYFSMS